MKLVICLFLVGSVIGLMFSYSLSLLGGVAGALVGFAYDKSEFGKSGHSDMNL